MSLPDHKIDELALEVEREIAYTEALLEEMPDFTEGRRHRMNQESEVINVQDFM